VGVSGGRAFLAPWVLWPARFAACFFLIIGALIFVTFLETLELRWLGVSAAAIVGAGSFIVGLERPLSATGQWARPVGWAAMAAASFLPSSLLFIPTLIVLLGIPALVVQPRLRSA
jgi:hypothetical protein